ncbi:MAG: hypothetical protein ACM3Q4_06785, partial [Acidobacteriota bacterium]
RRISLKEKPLKRQKSATFPAVLPHEDLPINKKAGPMDCACHNYYLHGIFLTNRTSAEYYLILL